MAIHSQAIAAIDAAIDSSRAKARIAMKKLADSKRASGDFERADKLDRMLAMSDVQFDAALDMIGGGSTKGIG